MRHIIVLFAIAVLAAGCASTSSTPAASDGGAVQAAAKKPQCYSGDAGRFFQVGEKTTIAGLEVSCVATSDGKAGQWMGAKHHK